MSEHDPSMQSIFPGDARPKQRPSDSDEPRDRRFQIFVSSTFRDLREQRKKAIEVIVDKGHIPIALENFSASHESDLRVIDKAISSSQIYLVILGHRYGELVPGTNKSYTELEYDLAVENKLLILTFILSDHEVIERRKELDPTKTDDKRELDCHAQLYAFRQKAKAHFWKPWGKADEFMFLVLGALQDNLSKCAQRALTWEPPPDQRLLTYASRNEFIVEIVKTITGFDKLDERCTENVSEKRELSRYFVEQYGNGILSNQVSLFLESGSTIAFVASELAKLFNERRRQVEIRTNNVLVYLHYWLTAGLDCTLFPRTSPREPYGATFGPIDVLAEEAPTYPPRPLSQDVMRALSELQGDSTGLCSMKLPALILGAVSALQVGDSFNVVISPDRGGREASPEDIRASVVHCRGPHVGSFRNKTFKRYLYSTNLPVMLFLTEEKIDFEVIVGRCHFILDGAEECGQLSWRAFCETYPLAFCVGCSGGNLEPRARAFETLGFEVLRGEKFSTTAFIARNRRFIEVFEGALRPGAAGY